MTAPGVFEWTSPHGHRYRRDQVRHHAARSRPTDRTDQPGPNDHDHHHTASPTDGAAEVVWSADALRPEQCARP